VPPKAPYKVLEGSLVHQGEWLPSKFSRWVPEQAKQNAAEVRAIQEKKKKECKKSHEVHGRPNDMFKKSSKRGQISRSQV
jgi:PIN domain nuclease of toxin-antitoxin system